MKRKIVKDKLVDGKLDLEANPAWKKGAEVHIRVDELNKTLMPTGKFNLERGVTIEVSKFGIIEKIYKTRTSDIDEVFKKVYKQ